MYTRLIKPFFDYVLAVIAMIVLSPLSFIIIILLLLFQRGNIFFIQQRPGLNEGLFNIIKFRTMSDLKDSDGKLLEERYRLTGIGAFLRRTSLDELPQIWNVLKGEMSFVGPRPLPVSYLELYSPEQRRRQIVKPGITGWTQVNGRHAIPWSTKLTFDIYYVSNISFILDLKIIVMTAIVLLSIKKDISLSEKPFTGN